MMGGQNTTAAYWPVAYLAPGTKSVTIDAFHGDKSVVPVVTFTVVGGETANEESAQRRAPTVNEGQ